VRKKQEVQFLKAFNCTVKNYYLKKVEIVNKKNIKTGQKACSIEIKLMCVKCRAVFKELLKKPFNKPFSGDFFYCPYCYSPRISRVRS
jgi:hypothetical protein